jgi:hypothetical protein
MHVCTTALSSNFCGQTTYSTCIHAYMHTHTYMHTCIHTYIHTHDEYIHTHIYTYTHTRSPVIPFVWSNYLFGLTPVAILPYAAGTFFGTLPGVSVFVSAGTHTHAMCAYMYTYTCDMCIYVHIHMRYVHICNSWFAHVCGFVCVCMCVQQAIYLGRCPACLSVCVSAGT